MPSPSTTIVSSVGRVGQNVQGGGDGLGEHRVLVGHRVRYVHEAAFRDRQALGERAVAAYDAKHRPRRAVMLVAAKTRRASAARRVDIGDDAASDPARRVRLQHFTDELVSEHAAKAHVAARELQIRVADARDAHPDQGFPGGSHGFGVVLVESRRAIADECAHGYPPAQSR